MFIFLPVKISKEHIWNTPKNKDNLLRTTESHVEALLNAYHVLETSMLASYCLTEEGNNAMNNDKFVTFRMFSL